jgi:hypothetical protein
MRSYRGQEREWTMPKILLFRVAQGLNASLVSELSRAGYDVATPEKLRTGECS